MIQLSDKTAAATAFLPPPTDCALLLGSGSEVHVSNLRVVMIHRGVETGPLPGTERAWCSQPEHRRSLTVQTVRLSETLQGLHARWCVTVELSGRAKPAGVHAPRGRPGRLPCRGALRPSLTPKRGYPRSFHSPCRGLQSLSNAACSAHRHCPPLSMLCLEIPWGAGWGCRGRRGLPRLDPRLPLVGMCTEMHTNTSDTHKARRRLASFRQLKELQRLQKG